MQVVRESPASRRTITLTQNSFDLLDHLRGGVPKSVFFEELLATEKKRRADEAFYRGAVTAYTPEVRSETLKLNDDIPFATE